MPSENSLNQILQFHMFPVSQHYSLELQQAYGTFGSVSVFNNSPTILMVFRKETRISEEDLALLTLMGCSLALEVNQIWAPGALFSFIECEVSGM